MHDRIVDGILHIEFDNRPKSMDLISSIKSLQAITAAAATPAKREPAPAPAPAVDPGPPFKFSDMSKLKKKGKKKKGKKGNFDDVDFVGLSSSGITLDEEEEAPKERPLRFLDADLAFTDEPDEDDLIDEINREQRSEYKKKNGAKDTDFENKFRQEITILYELLDEVNKFGKDLDKKYRSLESSRARGSSKYVNDLILSILTSKTSKLNIIKEIANIKKVIQDLRHKEATRNKDSEGSTSRDQLAASYISKLISGDGRAKMMERIAAPTVYQTDDDDDDEETRIAREEYEERRHNSDFQQARIFDMIEKRLDEEGTSYRSEDADRYIKYENRGVNIYIKRCIDEGTWEFMAIDRDGIEVPDYPLPRRESVGKVTFSADGRMATDARGITYKVKEFFSPIDEE